MKYMGSKSRIKKYVVPILQDIIEKNKIDLYIEPFVGTYNNQKTDNCKVCIFSVEEHREPIGTLTFKTNGSKKESKIDVFTWEEIDGEVIVNDYIHLSKRI